MRIEVVKALSDNYMYLVTADRSNIAVAIDPVDPSELLLRTAETGMDIVAVLTTHHHWDHAGGNLKLLDEVPGIPVFGGDERISGISRIVNHGEVLHKGNLNIKCLRTPCHTTGHVCYYITENQGSRGAVFTGDTLFIGGCGRFFEGNAQEMVTALLEILGVLPDETLVYCGHEYTVKNLLFAKTVEPQNEDVTRKLAWAQYMREGDHATVPSTIGEEKTFNPFMRVANPGIQRKYGKSDAVETMRLLRTMKNNFS